MAFANIEDHRKYQREYVRRRLSRDAEFKKKHDARANAYRKETREWLAAYKMARGCADCGFRGHFAALQLDHEGPKAVDISTARSSIKRLLAEIEQGQCRVRCANCHAVRTWQQKQEAKTNG